MKVIVVRVVLVTPVFVKSKNYRQPGFIAQHLLFNLFLAASLFSPASADNNDGAKDLGVDYALMSLMTLSPDVAAANYTIHNNDGSDVEIAIGRLPYHIDLFKNKQSYLQFELVVAYQHTEEVVKIFPEPDENIDARWDTYGAGLGLLYERKLTQNLRFTPSLRLGVASMENNATYNGTLTNLFKDTLDGTILNWKTNTSIINLGLGLSYNWELLDRASSIKMNAYHVLVDSFSESNAAVEFSESANMLTVKADMIFPTNITLHGERLDIAFLLGANNFYGANRDTLGYSTSYQAGFGAEFPLKWQQKKHGYLRLGGQFLWANNMDGWMLSLGYNSG
jgi:hypothetical protein